MPRTVKFALAAVCLVLCHSPLRGEQHPPYTGNANACITGAFYAKPYKWYAYPNNCSDDIRVAWVSKDGRQGGYLDIPAERSKDIARTEREIDAMGGVEAYACPKNYDPLDLKDRVITKPVSNFRCKYRGF
jgi:hypothetical protein